MLFNSFIFLFAFLPVTLIVTILLLRTGKDGAVLPFIVFASLFFYGYWNPSHVWVIIASLLFNYAIGNLICAMDERGPRRWIVGTGVAANLGLLGFFKYLGFFTSVFEAAESGQFFAGVVDVALPIGISFYTFQQIAYLLDCHMGLRERPYTITEYMFFVTFFPQLIAGPIVHHGEIMPQLSKTGDRLRSNRYLAAYFVPGISLLIVGLSKKVILADTFGRYAEPVFKTANMTRVTFLDAWGGASAYTLQIYFDFSAYSDMAIALGLLFGLKLPINFDSPYKSTSIIEFWRRWHITLSRFLRDYLYIFLGGNRKGAARRYVNILITMLLGGLWHGANWTFVVWGGLHGLLLILNHWLRRTPLRKMPVWVSLPVTLFLVILTWVAFRAESFEGMFTLYGVMFGADGIVLPYTFSSLVAYLDFLPAGLAPRSGNIVYFGGTMQILATVCGFLIVVFAPNSLTLISTEGRRRIRRQRRYAVGFGLLAVVSMIIMWSQTNVTFLYFQF